MTKVNEGDLKLDSSDKIVFTDTLGAEHEIFWDSILGNFIIDDSISGDFLETVSAVVDIRPPDENDDSFKVPTIWINSITSSAYVCVYNEPASAIWTKIPDVEEMQDIMAAMIGDTTNISVVYDDFSNEIDFTVPEASDSVLGVATFNTDNFAVGSGDVTIKTSGVNADELATSIDAEPKGFNASSVNSTSVNDSGEDTESLWTATRILEYVNSVAFGLIWQEEVISQSFDGPPVSPSPGDRYIVSTSTTPASGDWTGHDDEIAEFVSGSTWDYTLPLEGMSVYISDEDENYSYNGTAWVKIGGTITHNNLLGLQGGVTDEYYHFTQAQYSSITGNKQQNTVFVAPSGSDGIASFRVLQPEDIPNIDSSHINFFVEDVQDVVGTMTGTTTNISIVYDDSGNVINYSVPVATDTILGVASFDSSNFTITAGDITINDASIDHGSISGLTDDDHSQYVHITNSRTIVTPHTFNPSSATAPFILGANAQKQLITGLDTDYVRGQAWTVAASASPPSGPVSNDIWIEIV